MDNIHSINFSSNNTVDRKKETKFLLSNIEQKNIDVIIIYSETGIGKSTLSNRITKKCRNYIPITVRTSPENNSMNATEGFFLSKVFSQCVKFFQKYSNEYKNYSFNDYLRLNENELVRRNALEKCTNINEDGSLKSIGIALSKYVFSRMFLLNDYNSYPKLLLDSKDSMLIAHEYIKYLITELPLLINIDNLQNIDSYSYQLLTEWIAVCTRNSIFLLEYTISKEHPITHLTRIASEWRNYDLDVCLLELGALDANYAIEALHKMYISTQNETLFFEEAKKYYLSHSNGNMQKLIDFSLQYSQNSPLNNCYDPTLERINLLSNPEKFILAIIILHGGEIEKNILKYLTDLSVSLIILEFEKILKHLEDAYYLKTEENIVRIIHPSLIDAWNNNPKLFEKYNLLAFKLCKNYYMKYLDSSIPLLQRELVDQASLFLLKVYSKYDPPKLEPLLSTIGKLVSEQITPDHVWEYYMIFLEYVKDNEKEHLSSLYDMVIFCFNHGLYKNCLYIIQILEKYRTNYNKDFLFIYKINCYTYLELADAMNYCEKYLTLCENDSQRYLIYLLLMGIYRSLNDMDTVAKYVSKIQEIPDYTMKAEYGIFLRLSEIYMPRHEALPYVKRSVEYYVNHSDILMEARSRLTYSFLLAVTNDIGTAEKELNICKQLVSENHYWEGILALDEASLKLLQKKHGKDTAYLLKKAKLSIYSSFDLLLTLTMDLINEYEITHSKVSSLLVKQITQLLINEADKHLICLVAYDLYLYFNKIGDIENSQHYYKMAQEYSVHNVTVSMKLKGERNIHTPNVFNVDWAIGFTFFWSVDIPKPVS